MMSLRRWQGAAVVLACWGLLVPQTTVFADASPAKDQAPVIKAADVALTNTGVLRGSVFTPNGKHVDGATVAVLQGETVVAHTTTDTHGTFAVSELKPGAYQVVVGNHGAPVRVWESKTAPPTAHTRAIFVVGKPVVRGQSCPNGCPDGYCQCGGGAGFFGLDVITLFTLGASATAAVLAGINQSDLDDLDEKVDRLLSP